MKTILKLAACAALALTVLPAHAAGSAKDFADSRGLVTEAKAREYLIRSGGVSLADVISDTSLSLDKTKVTAATDKMIFYWRDSLGAAPWPWEKLDPSEDKPEPNLHPGITAPILWSPKTGAKSTGSRGPFRLRKNMEEAAKTTFTKAGKLDEKALRGVSGASLGFQNNLSLDGNGAWNSEGALAYPFNWTRQHKEAGSTTFTFLPAATWKVAEAEATTANEIEELGFHLPVNVFSRFSGYAGLKAGLDPYYETDFSWQHEIYGATASLEYLGNVAGGFKLGVPDWLYEGSPVSYTAHVTGLLDYSETGAIGPHTTRLIGDDWLRLGAQVSLDLQFGHSKTPIEIGASYKFLEELHGHSGSSSYLDAHLKWPINLYTAMTLKYQKGNTPAADEPIDMLTLGMEFKY